MAIVRYSKTDLSNVPKHELDAKLAGCWVLTVDKQICAIGTEDSDFIKLKDIMDSEFNGILSFLTKTPEMPSCTDEYLVEYKGSKICYIRLMLSNMQIANLYNNLPQRLRIDYDTHREAVVANLDWLQDNGVIKLKKKNK